MARTRRAGRRIKRGGVPKWYANAAKKTAEIADQAAAAAKGHAAIMHTKHQESKEKLEKDTLAKMKMVHADIVRQGKELGAKIKDHPAKIKDHPKVKHMTAQASALRAQGNTSLAVAQTAHKFAPYVPKGLMKGGLRRRKTTLKYKHPKKGMKSRTRKGRKDFTTKKTSKVFNRRKHYQRKSAKGVKRRPFRKCKCIC